MVILRGSRVKGDEVALEVLKNVNKKVPIHVVFVGGKSLVRHYSKTMDLTLNTQYFLTYQTKSLLNFIRHQMFFSIHLMLKVSVYLH